MFRSAAPRAIGPRSSCRLAYPQELDAPSFKFALELIESRRLITNDLAAQPVRKKNQGLEVRVIVEFVKLTRLVEQGKVANLRSRRHRPRERITRRQKQEEQQPTRKLRVWAQGQGLGG